MLKNVLPILLSLIVFAFGPSMANAQTPCHLLTSANPIPEGYGAAHNLFSSAREVLLEFTCDRASNAVFHIGNGQDTFYIYRTAYEWTGSRWMEIALNGQRLVGDWYVGSAAVDLPRSEHRLAENNFVVAYTCSRVGTQWKCGCRDDACRTSFWQLQAFRHAAADEATGGSSTNNCAARGYTRLWSATPSDSDIGTPIHTYLDRNGFAIISGAGLLNLNRMSVARAPTGEPALRVRNTKGSNNDTVFRSNQQNSADSMCVRYRMYLAPGSDIGNSNQVSKLPGLWGGDSNFRYVGCNSDGLGDKGFSARLGWGSGQTALYLYYMNNNTNCGKHTLSGFNIPVGQWFLMEQEVVMNTVGRSDGAARHWVNGEHETADTGIIWRTNSGIKPRGLFFNTYFGGSTFVSPVDQDWYFRDFEIYVR